MEEMTIQEVLEFAKLNEERGKKFYEDAIPLVEQNGAKKFLQELADEETLHISKLSEMQKKISSGGVVPKISKSINNLSSISKSSQQVTLDKDADFVDIVKHAIEHEKDAVRNYTQFADSVDDGAVKDLFTLLANEEREHLKKFEVSYDDFTDETSHEKIQELINKLTGG